MDVSCHMLFFLVFLLNQRWSPPLRLQDSHCSTFRIVCDVPSIAVFCNAAIECFPGTASKLFLTLLVTIPVAPIIIGIIVHLGFHIRFIYMHKLLYFNFSSASFCTTFLPAGIATSISVHVFSFLFLIIISGLFALTFLSLCTAWFHNTVTSPSSYAGLGMCVCPLSVISVPKAAYWVMQMCTKFIVSHYYYYYYSVMSTGKRLVSFCKSFLPPSSGSKQKQNNNNSCCCCCCCCCSRRRRLSRSCGGGKSY